MKNNEIVSIPHGNGKASLWVPSRWVDVTVLHWPGTLWRYNVWQRIGAQLQCTKPFGFDCAVDLSERKTWASVLQLQQDKWQMLPVACEQIRLLTAPKAMASHLLPRYKAPFALLAYRWQGQVELCAYRLGLLQHAERGQEISAIWSKVVQSMPVLAAAPLYATEAFLTEQFEPYHRTCHTLPAACSALGRFFESMREPGAA